MDALPSPCPCLPTRRLFSPDHKTNPPPSHPPRPSKYAREAYTEDSHVLVLGGEEGDCSLADGVLKLADLVQGLQEPLIQEFTCMACMSWTSVIEQTL